MRRLAITSLAVLSVCSLAPIAVAQGPGFRGGRGGPGPDPSFAKDRNDFHFLLEHHDEIWREVKQLDNGVETLTESDDAEVAAKIQQHVAAMYGRIDQNRPIRMRDPLFAEIFRHAASVEMEFAKTPKGVRVVETSDNPYVVQLIKAHAQVVSAFVNHGFEEAHKTHEIPGRPDSGGGAMHANEDLGPMVFVEFDRVYIPALALTNQQKPAANKALDRLSKAWDTRFVEHFHQMFSDDSQWPRDLSRVAQAIALAQAEMKAGKPLKAHEELEPIRDMLMKARRRNDFRYALDTLSQFHSTMEAIVKPAVQLDATKLDSSQIESLAELAEQADQEWKLVEETNFDLGQLGKTDEAVQQFPMMLRAERQAISELHDALSSNDKESILKAARALKPPFAKVYMFFGDLPTPISLEPTAR